MIHDKLKLALVTEHVPIKSISEVLNKGLLDQKIEQVIKSLNKDFLIKKPKIAVLGYNPHCGDNGVIGNEDEKIIVPIIKRNFDRGRLIFGPFSSDGFFGSEEYKRFDAVIAIYHDQGLVPFKMLSFGEGVNFTAGLDYVRTSPDHGTAFDIAGKGLAKINSFREALFKSRLIYLNRNKKIK
jgi:4-hydroxythreonine-4-phosphate dehydrogenase